MATLDDFRAFRVHGPAGNEGGRLERLALSDLNPGSVVVRVAYSSVNYKDALAGTGRGKILRKSPLVGGIDLAGHVESSSDPRFREGQQVLVTGSGLSETRDGGYTEFARLDPDTIIPLPEGLSLEEAMVLGTAGFTAGLALLRMLDNGQRPELGPLVVTGATGGVGSLAVDVFTTAGFEVHAVSGRPEFTAYLQRLGARRVLGREELSPARPLESAQFGGGLDNVGGETLVSLLSRTSPYGSVASAGLVASAELPATVMPFIIRGVSLLGVASAGCPRPLRERVWEKLSGPWKPRNLELVRNETVELEELPRVFSRLLEGGGSGRGRTLVRIAGS